MMPSSKDIQAIQNEYKWFYPLIAGGLLIVTGIILGAFLFGNTSVVEGHLLEYSMNLWTEAISISITITILDQLNRRRDESNKLEELKERLLRESRSTVNNVALQAIHEIRARNWLFEKSILAGANLNRANLRQCDFQDANLEKTSFASANLSGANMDSATLRDANFWTANLEGAVLANGELEGANFWSANLLKADFRSARMVGCDFGRSKAMRAIFSGGRLMDAKLDGADLSGAKLGSVRMMRSSLKSCVLCDTDLSSANLEDTNLDGADLSGADLGRANLRRANLTHTIFSPETILPDANIIGIDADKSLKYDLYWSEDTDMSRYTNPEHSDFWEPEWVIELRARD